MRQAIAKATERRYYFDSAGILLKFIFQNMFSSKQVGEITWQNMYVWDINDHIILFYIPFLFVPFKAFYKAANNTTYSFLK